jgi:hypothetical protein
MTITKYLQHVSSSRGKYHAFIHRMSNIKRDMGGLYKIIVKMMKNVGTFFMFFFLICIQFMIVD